MSGGLVAEVMQLREESEANRRNLEKLVRLQWIVQGAMRSSIDQGGSNSLELLPQKRIQVEMQEASSRR